MEQLTSTKTIAENGTTLLNCKFSMEEILNDCLKYLVKNGYISYEKAMKISKNVRTLNGFNLVWDELIRALREVNDGNFIPTKQGNIVHIANGGFSKVVFCFEVKKKDFTNKRGQLQSNGNRIGRFVIKFNRENNTPNDLETFGNKGNDKNDACQQVKAECEMYKSIIGTNDEKYFCPSVKYMKMYNACISGYADHIASIYDNAEYLGIKDLSEYEEIARKYGIYRDIFNGNSGNTGIINGRLVFIDYGLTC